MKKAVEFKELIGLTIESIEGLERTSEHIKIITKEGRIFEMYHDQDCCEYVYLADIIGDANIKGKVINAIVDTDRDEEPEKDSDDSWTWTYYHLETDISKVTLRWFGSSNGYYSEEVDFYELKEQECK